MEADWAAEIGGGCPVIEADWAGFVDLRESPGEGLAEVAEFPALGQVLEMLNRSGPAVLTSKCDVWRPEAGEVDPLEMEATACGAALAAWIDLVSRDAGIFGSFEEHERWARRAAGAMRGIAARNGRIDLVIRAAERSGVRGFGLTLYAVGCGADSAAAGDALAGILRHAAAVTMETAPARASSSIG